MEKINGNIFGKEKYKPIQISEHFKLNKTYVGEKKYVLSYQDENKRINIELFFDEYDFFEIDNLGLYCIKFDGEKPRIEFSKKEYKTCRLQEYEYNATIILNQCNLKIPIDVVTFDELLKLYNFFKKIGSEPKITNPCTLCIFKDTEQCYPGCNKNNHYAFEFDVDKLCNWALESDENYHQVYRMCRLLNDFLEGDY